MAIQTNTNENEMVAFALLEEVENKVDGRLGNIYAMRHDADNPNKELLSFCRSMVNQCQLAESKAPNSHEVLRDSNAIKGRLYGCMESFNLSKSINSYEESIRLGKDEAQLRYQMALVYRVNHKYNDAKEAFEKVIQIEGPTSKLGIECAKEIAKDQNFTGNPFVKFYLHGGKIAAGLAGFGLILAMAKAPGAAFFFFVIAGITFWLRNKMKKVANN